MCSTICALSDAMSNTNRRLASWVGGCKGGVVSSMTKGGSLGDESGAGDSGDHCWLASSNASRFARSCWESSMCLCVSIVKCSRISTSSSTSSASVISVGCRRVCKPSGERIAWSSTTAWLMKAVAFAWCSSKSSWWR